MSKGRTGDDAPLTCRTCRSTNTSMFLSLGDHPPANAFLSHDQLSQHQAAFSLDIHTCFDCGLIQVPNVIQHDFFRNYVYVPSASDAMVEHFADLAHQLMRQFAIPQGALVVDVGSNDGTFLSNFKDSGIRALGIEPASNLARTAEARGVPTVNEFFSEPIARTVCGEHGTAAVIVTTNTFNHIDDLDEFVAGVAALLDEHGVFVIEVPHALDLLQKNEFDTVYHEHLSQFSVASLQRLFARFDMQIADIEPLWVHGGSMRVFASKVAGKLDVSDATQEWTARERDAGLLTPSTYSAFAHRVEQNRTRLRKLLGELIQQGKRIAGYGAPAKGNTLLNYCGLDTEMIDYLVDRNPLKHGLYSPGVRIPIFPPNKLIADRPDYVLILAWNFADEIIAQQAEFRALGGQFIIPIPEPTIVPS